MDFDKNDIFFVFIKFGMGSLKNRNILCLLFFCKVEYQEKQYAKRMIPGTFTRREGPPKERELLCGRLIDRPIRPLFPAGFYHEVQVEKALYPLAYVQFTK